LIAIFLAAAKKTAWSTHSLGNNKEEAKFRGGGDDKSNNMTHHA